MWVPAKPFGTTSIDTNNNKGRSGAWTYLPLNMVMPKTRKGPEKGDTYTRPPVPSLIGGN